MPAAVVPAPRKNWRTSTVAPSSAEMPTDSRCWWASPSATTSTSLRCAPASTTILTSAAEVRLASSAPWETTTTVASASWRTMTPVSLTTPALESTSTTMGVRFFSPAFTST